MRSKTSLLRRSGVALYNVAQLLEWSPTLIVQAGVGHYCKETEVFREAWPEASLIGFEPHPEVCHRLDHEKFPGLLVRQALGRRVGWAKLFFDPAHVDGASVYDDSSNCRLQEVEVKITTLDEYYNNMDCPRPDDRALLWLDCEGGELDVLIGGERFVERVDVINVELTGKPPRPGWPEPVAVNRWLLDRGFLLQYAHTQRTTSGQVDAIYVRPKLFRPEYCPCPLQVEAWRKDGA